MKKNEVEVKKLKKLRLSRETLQTLTSSNIQQVVGGTSPQQGGCISTSPDEPCDTA